MATCYVLFSELTMRLACCRGQDTLCSLGILFHSFILRTIHYINCIMYNLTSVLNIANVILMSDVKY